MRLRSVESPHRPVFAGYLPRFSSQELDARLLRVPWHLATLLYPPNILLHIDKYGSDRWTDYLGLSSGSRLALHLECLRSLGFSQKTIDAIGLVDRSRFVPATMEWAAHLNWSIPIDAGSCLSNPVLVSAMTEWLPDLIDGNIIEIGSGSGFHTAILRHLYPDNLIITYEANRAVSELGCRNLEKHGYSNIVQHTRLAPDDFGRQTGLRIETRMPSIVEGVDFDNLRPECTWIAPRLLSQGEYNAFPSNGKLRKTFTSYGEYALANTSRECVLHRSVHDGESFVELSRLYSVVFVEQLTEVTPGKIDPQNTELDKLINSNGKMVQI
ncbi:hypothetical protein [Williamsia muralis]|uniref:hypothetical protein n=1 Tax=Williamsia marianensis TaxID=85044 RepID=UPI0026A1E8C2